MNKEKPTFLRPTQLAQRWSFNPESVRRKIRRGEIASVVIGRQRLIPLDEIERIEREGTVGKSQTSVRG